MNLDNIKTSGFRIGLEAELNVQRRHLDENIKANCYVSALGYAENCVTLLHELNKICVELPTPKTSRMEELR